MGAIAVPLSGLFGPDALRHRLGDSGARVVITDAHHEELHVEVGADLDGFDLTVVGAPGSAHTDFWSLVARGAKTFEASTTNREGCPSSIGWTPYTGSEPMFGVGLHGRPGSMDLAFGSLPVVPGRRSWWEPATDEEER